MKTLVEHTFIPDVVLSDNIILGLKASRYNAKFAQKDKKTNLGMAVFR